MARLFEPELLGFLLVPLEDSVLLGWRRALFVVRREPSLLGNVARFLRRGEEDWGCSVACFFNSVACFFNSVACFFNSVACFFNSVACFFNSSRDCSCVNKHVNKKEGLSNLQNIDSCSYFPLLSPVFFSLPMKAVVRRYLWQRRGVTYLECFTLEDRIPKRSNEFWGQVLVDPPQAL